MTKIHCQTTRALREHLTFFLLKCILYCRSKIVVWSNYSEGATKERMGVPGPSAGEALMTGAQYGIRECGSSVCQAHCPPSHTYLYESTLAAVSVPYTTSHLKFCNAKKTRLREEITSNFDIV